MRQLICTSCISKELWVFKIIIIYAFFIKFIDNKKLEKSDGVDDDVYT
jgi:hypothetical protein